MSRDAILVIGDILSSELGLAAGQVMLTNERYQIPQTNGTFVALSYVSGKPVANNNYAVPADGGGLTEVQELVMNYEIQIDILSFDGSARTNKDIAYMALRSVFAEQAMEINNMQVASMATGFVDASSLEESKMLNRYTMSIHVTALVTRTKPVDYFNQFATPEVHANA